MPPRFVICPICGQHGHLILSDGSPSFEFGSKEMAYTILDATAECHLIDDQESAIRTDIVNSTLPDTDHDVQFELVGSLAELNYLIEKGEDSAVTATEIHVFVWQYVGGEKRELRPPTSEHRDAVNLRNELIF